MKLIIKDEFISLDCWWQFTACVNTALNAMLYVKEEQEWRNNQNIPVTWRHFYFIWLWPLRMTWPQPPICTPHWGNYSQIIGVITLKVTRKVIVTRHIRQLVTQVPDSQRGREAGPTVPDPGETLWFGVSFTHTPQGSILHTHRPVFTVAIHLCVRRDW